MQSSSPQTPSTPSRTRNLLATSFPALASAGGAGSASQAAADKALMPWPGSAAATPGPIARRTDAARGCQ